MSIIGDLTRELHEAVTADNQDWVAEVTARIDDWQRTNEARLDAPDALYHAAVWYAEHGVPVFPLTEGSKKPLPGSNGFKDATCDLTVVKKMWTSPDRTAPVRRNIGTPTGAAVGLDVIDIDGPAGFRSALDPHLELPTPVARALTPHGEHLFVPASGRGNKASLFDGVDYRGEGGYVVLPPSKIDPPGCTRCDNLERPHRYSWITEPIGGTTL